MMLAANYVVFGLEIPDSDLGLRSSSELPQLFWVWIFHSASRKEVYDYVIAIFLASFADETPDLMSCKV